MDQENPYQSPTAASMVYQVPEVGHFPLATQGQRFINYLLDQVICIGLGFMVGIGFALFGATEIIERIPGFVVGSIIVLVYYIPQETLLGRTLGKLATGTKAVRADGSPLGFGQVLGRTFARLIPFEAFSFLGSKPIGWHDNLSGTRVVQTR